MTKEQLKEAIMTYLDQVDQVDLFCDAFFRAIISCSNETKIIIGRDRAEMCGDDDDWTTELKKECLN